MDTLHCPPRSPHLRAATRLAFVLTAAVLALVPAAPDKRSRSHGQLSDVAPCHATDCVQETRRAAPTPSPARLMGL